MDSFVAIDFETANLERSSVCSIGLVVVRNGEIADKIYRLIRPTPNWYSKWNTAIHGLARKDTDAALHFPDVWAELAPQVAGLPFVAHNAPFDKGCLQAVVRAYRLDYIEPPFLCTLSMSRRILKGKLPNYQLKTVAAYCDYRLENHHHALADAEACAAIALRLFALTKDR